MPENNLSEDLLLVRAIAHYMREGRKPNPSLKNSRTLELDNKRWVELRSYDDETIGLYKLTPHGQLRRK